MAKKKNAALYNILFVILSLYALSIIALVLWGFINSIKSESEFRNNVLGLPVMPTIENYIIAFKHLNVELMRPDLGRVSVSIWLQIWYSVAYALGAALSSTVATAATAYVTAKFPFKKFNAIILNIVIVTMILPIVGSLPSALQVNRMFGLYNKLWAPVITGTSFLGIYYLVLLAFYKGIPDSFMEAAYIDGASEWQVFVKIIMPLSLNIFNTIVLIKFVGYWQDYQSPLIFLPSYPTLAYGVFLFGLSTGTRLSHVPMKLTACFILLIPVLVLFIAFSDRLTGNIRMGGIKG